MSELSASESLYAAGELFAQGHTPANALALVSGRSVTRAARLALLVSRAYDGGSLHRYAHDAPQWLERATLDGVLTVDVFKQAARDALCCPACKGSGLVAEDQDCYECDGGGMTELPEPLVWVGDRFHTAAQALDSRAVLLAELVFPRPIDQGRAKWSVTVRGGSGHIAASHDRFEDELLGIGESYAAASARALLKAQLAAEDWLSHRIADYTIREALWIGGGK